MSERPQGAGFATLAIHAGAGPDPTAGRPAIPVEAVADDAAFATSGLEGQAADPVCALLEERIAALEGGSAALAVASGQTARLIAFQALLQPGDELIASRQISSEATGQFDHAFKSFGWQVRWVDAERPESFVEALSDRTKAIFIESIAHSGGTVSDVETIANVARRARVPLIVDNTLATPYLARPFEHGADIIVHTDARFLSGHGDALGGFILDGGSFDWSDERYPCLSRPQASCGGLVFADTFGNFAFATACRALGLRDLGAEMSPFHAGRVLHGIETLSLRMQRHSDNALAVAEHLGRHGAVTWVRYAALKGDIDNALARPYCPRGAGAVFTFGLAGGREAAVALVKRLKLFSLAGRVGEARSSIVPAASSGQSHRSDEVRVSIGLEDAADIIADLDQALG